MATSLKAARAEAGSAAAPAKRNPPPAARSVLGPGDWIAAATDVLVHNGIDAVRVDVLARQLNVSRGSFYWHFGSRADLLRRMLLAWQVEQTEQIIARYRRQALARDELIRELTELPFHGRAAVKGSSVELTIRAWARHDDMARAVVDEVDAKRLSYLQECFLSLGFERQQAGARAFVLYCYMQSESMLRNQGSESEKRERRRFVADMLLAPA
jgi:AcrR family transcriptional regulator